MKLFVCKILIILFSFLLLTSCGSSKLFSTGYIHRDSPHSKRIANGSRIPNTQRPYIVNGKAYYPISTSDGYVEKGVASWYGRKFHGRRTANGEVYSMYAKTAAHKTLPINTMLLVQNLENGKETVVRVNDRGPFVKRRIIDLSLVGAQELGMVRKGTAVVRITALGEVGTYQENNKSIIRFLPHEDFEAGEFYVQIGSFTKRSNADKLKNKMVGWGRKATVNIYNDGFGIYYRVHVQAGNTLSTAKRVARILNEAGYPGFVVSN